jgi:3-phenylpropionate/cinnamic acid dioxygenase small subunit
MSVSGPESRGSGSGWRALSAEQAWEVQQLLSQWAWLLDTGRWHDASELLTEDAVVIGLGPPRLGPSGFREWADERAQQPGRLTRHQLSNFRMAGSHQYVTATTLFVLYVLDASHREPYQALVGEYEDTCLATPSGMRFVRREIRTMDDVDRDEGRRTGGA